MKNRMFIGAPIAVLGLLIAVVPQWIFPVCSEMAELAGGGTMPMKCFWTARAELGIGLLILCGGLFLMFMKSRESRMGIGIMTALTGVLGVLVPTVLIGVCGMNMMPCRMTTLPALIILNVLVIILCLVHLIYGWRGHER